MQAPESSVPLSGRKVLLSGASQGLLLPAAPQEMDGRELIGPR